MPITGYVINSMVNVIGLIVLTFVVSITLPADAKTNANFSEPSESAKLQNSCLSHFENGDMTSAVSGANVTLANSSESMDYLTRFSVLLCRAKAYDELSKDEASELDYREALRIAEKQFGPFEPELIEPLTALGRLRLSSSDEDEAELLLLRARDITHRNSGIFNVEQDKLLKDLTSIYMSTGRLEQAKHQQQLKLRAAEEHYGESPELVEALHDYANWAARVGDFSKVTASIERALAIQEAAYGEFDLRLVETLRLRAKLYEYHPILTTPRTGERALQRVAGIYAAQDQVDQVDLMKARTDLGDWYLRNKRTVKRFKGNQRTLRKGKALSYYKAAVKQAIDEGVDQELINQFYGAPKLIRYEKSKTQFYGRNNDKSLTEGGEIIVEFNVSARGSVRNLRIIKDSVNNQDVIDAVLFRVETSYFRPRFVDGRAVAVSGVRYRFQVDQTGQGRLRVGDVNGPIFVSNSASN